MKMMLPLVSAALCILVCAHGASLPVGAQTDSAATTKTTDAYCEINGQHLQPGQRVNQNSFVYECQFSENMIGAKIVACLDEQGSVHQIGDRWNHGQAPFQFVLECAKNNGITSRSVVQCAYNGPDGQAKIEPDTEQRVGNKVIRCKRRQGNGLEYAVQYDPASPVPVSSSNAGSNTIGTSSNQATINNDSVHSGSPNSVSTNSGSSTSSSSTSANTGSSSSSTSTQKEPTCTFNGEELGIGQRTSTTSFVYECQRSSISARAVIVACLDDKKGEHPVGQRWTEMDEKPFGFVFECVKDGDETAKRAVQCDYNSDDGQAKLSPGQEQTVGKYVIQCQQLGTNGVKYHIQFTKAYLASLSGVKPSQ